MANGVKAGEAFVEILANTTRLEKGLRRAQAKLRAFSKSAISAGVRMNALALASATPFIAGAKVFADFETQMAKVGTLLDGNEKQLESFSMSIKGLSKEFGESTEVLASGLFDIVSASVPAEKAINVLRESVKLAKAGFTDTAIAADAITTVLNAFSLSADNAGEVADFLFQTAKAGKTDLAKLAPNIGKVATLSATAGLSLEEMGAALSTITRAGISTEEATTGLVAIIGAFLKPSDEAAKTAKSLGFEMSAAALKVNGLEKSFENLKDLDPETITKLFPNIRAVKGLLPVLKNLKAFKKDVSDLESRAGVTNKAFREITKTLTFLFNQVKQSGIGIFRDIGEELAGALKDAKSDILAVINAVSNFVRVNKQYAVTAVKVILAVSAIGTALIAVGAALFPVIVGIGVFSSAITAATVVASTLASALVALVSPIGVLIAGIVGLGVLLVSEFDLIKKGIKVISDAFARLKDSFKKSISAIVSALKAGEINLAFEVVMANLNLATVKGLAELKNLWVQFKTFIANLAVDIFTGISSAFNTEIGKIRKSMNDFSGFAIKQFFKIRDGFSDALDEVIGGLAKLTTSDQRVKLQIDADTTEKILGRDKDRGDTAAIIDKVTKQEKKDIDKETKSNEEIISTLKQSLKASIKSGQSDQEKKANADLIKAQERLKVAIENAEKTSSDQTDATKDGTDAVEDGGILSDFDSILAKFKNDIGNINFGDALKAKEGLRVTGGFNPFGLNLQSSDFQNQMLKSTKDNEKNTRKLARNQGTGGRFA